MNEESTQRITKTTAAFMIVVAVFFDAAQIASKILALMGLGPLGGIFGALACQYADIRATGACVAVGTTAGVAVSFIPVVGQALTAAATMIGMAASELASGGFMLVGYSTMYTWFLLRGVSIFGGKGMEKKAIGTFIAFLIDITPLLNAMPAITVWTIRMILITRAEDTEKATESKVRYNGRNVNMMRMRRSRVAQQTGDHAEEYLEAA